MNVQIIDFAVINDNNNYFLKEMYQLDAFTQSNPADQVFIKIKKKNKKYFVLLIFHVGHYQRVQEPAGHAQ